MWIKDKVKAIAEEALETARELRDVHSDDAHVRLNNKPPTTSISTTAPTQQPSFPASTNGNTFAAVTSTTNAPSSSAAAPGQDVAARLAALKAKIQTNKPPPTSSSVPTTTTTTTTTTQPATTLPPTTTTPVNPPPSLSLAPIKTTLPDPNSVEGLQMQLKEQHKHHQEVITTLQQQLNAERSAAADIGMELDELKQRMEITEAQSSAGVDALQVDLDRAKAEVVALREQLAIASSSQPTASGDSNELIALQDQLSSIKNELQSSNDDRAALKQQLARLKSQMLNEQEDEEEKIKWRVEAEIKLALERERAALQQIQPQQPAVNENPAVVVELRAQLDEERQRAKRLEAEATRWESEASARNAELANLNRALGELSYESEAAERLRAEVRSGQQEVHTLRTALDESTLARNKLEQQLTAAAAEREILRREIDDAKNKHAQSEAEVLKLHVALQETEAALREAQGTGGAISRHTVIDTIGQILRHVRRPMDILDTAAVSLGLLEQEKAALVAQIRAAPSKTSTSGGNAASDEASLANAWLNFLEDQVEVVDLASPTSDSKVAGGGSSIADVAIGEPIPGIVTLLGGGEVTSPKRPTTSLPVNSTTTTITGNTTTTAVTTASGAPLPL